MKTLLRLNASARTTLSYSNQLGNYYVECWQVKYPQGKVVPRDFSESPVPHLSNKTIEAFMLEEKQHANASSLSDSLITELKAADEVLICSPLYNLTLPSTLKAYFDHVVRSGHTFGFQQNGPIGLLSDKRATIITSRGGLSSSDKNDDFQTHYLTEILAFIGISTQQVINLEGTALANEPRQSYFDNAREQIHRWFNPIADEVWQGQFSSEDQQAINTLRNGQSQAIINGEAEAYANLCMDNIHLLIPGHDMIIGREKFMQTENALFDRTSFTAFDKYPTRIQRHGNHIVEIGYQRVTTRGSSEKKGVYSASQKYMHNYQLTDNGWKYTVLMSNDCG